MIIWNQGWAKMDSSKLPLSTDEETNLLTLNRAKIINVLEIIAKIIIVLEIIAVPLMLLFLWYAINAPSMTLSPLLEIGLTLAAIYIFTFIPCLVIVSMVILSINIALKRRLGCLTVCAIVCNVVVSIFCCSLSILMIGL